MGARNLIISHGDGTIRQTGDIQRYAGGGRNRRQRIPIQRHHRAVARTVIGHIQNDAVLIGIINNTGRNRNAVVWHGKGGAGHKTFGPLTPVRAGDAAAALINLGHLNATDPPHIHRIPAKRQRVGARSANIGRIPRFPRRTGRKDQTQRRQSRHHHGLIKRHRHLKRLPHHRNRRARINRHLRHKRHRLGILRDGVHLLRIPRAVLKHMRLMLGDDGVSGGKLAGLPRGGRKRCQQHHITGISRFRLAGHQRIAGIPRCRQNPPIIHHNARCQSALRHHRYVRAQQLNLAPWHTQHMRRACA